MTYALLVEDSSTDEVLTRRVLDAHGVPVRVVRDGAEALDFLFCRGAHAAREAGLPKVVLLDLSLPVVSGHEVLRAIRGHPALAALPVVVLSSSDESADVERGYAAGANSYVVKPVAFDAFRAAVAQVGVYWHRVDHGPIAGSSD